MGHTFLLPTRTEQAKANSIPCKLDDFICNLPFELGAWGSFNICVYPSCLLSLYSTKSFFLTMFFSSGPCTTYLRAVFPYCCWLLRFLSLPRMQLSGCICSLSMRYVNILLPFWISRDQYESWINVQLIFLNAHYICCIRC
jgi:hypothetical protein